jgi:hypothetical protein
MSEYFLPRHVHFCCRGDDFVFLDLRQDDYTLVNGDAAAALRFLDGHSSESRSEVDDALKELLEGGLLITDPAAGKSIRATRTILAMESLVDDEAPPRSRLSALHVCRFFAACVTAAARLRWGRLEEAVRTVEQRRQQHCASPNSFNVTRARELMAVFQELRSVFPRDYLCLYDSLALLEFLARYRIFPTWVFGIKLEPWAAHCWVQEGQFVFNEDVEEAAGYTPIMVV